MAKQFEPVDCSRGAPMGRRELREAREALAEAKKDYERG